MAILIGITLALLCIGVVVYPFFKTRTSRREAPSAPVAALVDPEGAADMDSIYEAMRTLQLEYQTGRVPEELYQEQFLAYRLQAAAALRDQDQVSNTEAAIESEIASVRTVMYGNASDSLPCPGCGSAVDATAGSCHECGTALVTSEAVPPEGATL